MPKIFFVTGCSSGFGHDFVQLLLDKGEYVVATARKPATLESFKNITDKNFLPVKLDIKNTEDIDAAFNAATTKFGRIDALVNNAGYGLAGAFETLSPKQIRDQFDTNFFGAMDVTRRALEVMRTQEPPGGVIQQNSSLAGQVSPPMMSAYAASKHALNGWTAAVAAEMKPEWNIRFNIVEPGPFRTDGQHNVMFGDIPHKDYDHMDVKAFFNSMVGTAPGDPIKGVDAMYKLACMDNPPIRAVLGDYALGVLRGKLDGDKEMYNRPDVVEIVTGLDLDSSAGSTVSQDVLNERLGLKMQN